MSDDRIRIKQGNVRGEAWMTDAGTWMIEMDDGENTEVKDLSTVDLVTETYTISEQAEWAENHAGIDQDFEADTLEEAYEIARSIAKGGSMWQIFDDNGRQVDGNC